MSDQPDSLYRENILWRIIRAFFRILWRLITWPIRFVKHIHELANSDPIDRPYSEIFDKISEDKSYRAELFEANIEHLRKHLLYSLGWLALGISLTAVYTQRISLFLIEPLKTHSELETVSLTAIQVSESLSVFMRIALLTGVIVAFPFIAFEVWKFLAEGLFPPAKKKALVGIPFASLLFVGGAAFCYYIILPAALIAMRLINDYMGYGTQWTPESYFSFTTGLLFWMGMGFEFPIIVWILADIGIVKPEMLLRQWRLAIVIIAVLAAAITPTVDPITMSLVMGPLIVLYFIGIGLSYLATRTKKPKPEAMPEN